MAEIIAAKRGSRAAAPRIDLTPMVDLGFLLITFFMMTTTMAKPKRMDIQMPYKPAPPGGTAFMESSAITLLSAKDHRIFYYEGVYRDNVFLKEVRNEEALRKVLLDKQQALSRRVKPGERELQVLIKAHKTATMQDLVTLFDEMDILQVQYFAMVDIYPQEASLVAAQLK